MPSPSARLMSGKKAGSVARKSLIVPMTRPSRLPGDDEQGRQRAFNLDRAAVGYFVAVGVPNFRCSRWP